MILQICSRLDEKFEKFEHNFTLLGMEMAELYKEYDKLKAQIARKEVEHSGQISLLENEVAKLRKENGILKSRLLNNAAEECEQQSKRMALKMCLRLDEKFEKFEHNFAFLGMEMAELYKEYAKLKEKFCGQIALLENEVAKLREQNGILTSRLMNNTTEAGEQNSAHNQFLANDNGILNIVEGKDIVEVIGICPLQNAEQQSEIGEQIEDQNQHYTTNPMDELNETSADGFGQIEEEDGLDEEEGEGIMPSDSMEMDGIRERMGDFYDNYLSPREGPSNIDANEEDGQKQQNSKKKRKFLKCQWPGCGYRKAKCKADMERHWRTHTGERPYCCSICGKSFSRLNIMKKHELREHNLT